MKKSKTQISGDGAARAEDVGKLIIDLLKEEVFSVDGCPTCTIKKEDGSYRKKAIMAGWEFFLTDCYVGQRGSLIFQFTPVDTQEFVLLETQMSEVDTVFPLLSSKLIDVAKTVKELGDQFMKLKGATERIGDVFAAIEATKDRNEEAASKKANAAYLENPKFGMF